MLLSLGLTFAGIEWFARTWDPYGIHYPHEVARYKAELMEPLVFRADGRVDHGLLDGALFYHKPNATVRFREFTVHTNAFGLRGPEISVAKPANTERIVILGDSVAFGWGVNDEDTFARRLEVDLRERFPERRFEVVNGGHLMYDSVQEVALLRERLVLLQPDLVLLVYVVNDIEPTRKILEVFDRWLEEHAGVEPPQPSFVERMETEFLATFWGTHAMIGHMFERVALLHATVDEASAPHGGPETRGDGVEGWERSQRALIDMRDLCRAHAIPFHLFDHCLPRIPSLEPFCKEHGIPYHDLRFTPSEMKQGITNSAIDAHANRRGNELLLRKLERGLADAGLYPFDVR